MWESNFALPLFLMKSEEGHRRTGICDLDNGYKLARWSSMEIVEAIQ